MLIVQSGLLRILDLVKTAPQQSKLDEISLLLAIKGKTIICLPSVPSVSISSVSGEQHMRHGLKCQHKVSLY